MKLSEIKSALDQLQEIHFILPDGNAIPTHFHVTEVGFVTKRFIDCGGTLRDESFISFQLWQADDFDHRLAPEKLKKIIALSEEKLQLQDLEVEVEYQSDTIGKYGLRFEDGSFHLTSKQTDCLASDKCGIPQKSTIKQKISLASLGKNDESCCTPNSRCC